MGATQRAVLRFPSGKRGASAQAKLDLVEFLLVNDDPEACANRAMAWLGRHTTVAQAMCMASGLDGDLLAPLGGLGISPVSAGEFTLRPDDRAHPLVVALDGTRAAWFPEGIKQPHTPLTDCGFHAFPLRADASDGRAAGLLLASAPSSAVDPDV